MIAAGAGFIASVLVDMAVLILVLGGLYWILPRWSRPELFFAVTVDPGFRQTPVGRAIQRRYEWQVVVHSGIGLLLLLAGGLAPKGSAFAGAMIVSSLFWQSVGVFIAFQRARRQVLPHRITTPVIREASLQPRKLVVIGGWLAQLGPFLLLALPCLYLAARWDDIPARFAIHWGLDGQPNGWATRSILGVYGIPIIATALLVMMLFIALAMQWGLKHARASGPGGEQESRFLRLTLALVLAVEYFLAITLGSASLLPLYASEKGIGFPLWVLFVLDPILVIIIGLLANRVGQGGWRLPVAEHTAPAAPILGDGTPDSYWRWGVFYVNPDDPAIWVQKRFGFGYTLNMANPRSWLILGTFFLFILGILALSLVISTLSAR
ncbi:MAG TPA: DUF5808 domain-containing protein [Tepidisphaeraceae bacterium]|nr:DUF5808 domain-containing protein [Tepidisphaeraceae bacterium]